MTADPFTSQGLAQRAQKLSALGHTIRLLILVLMKQAPRHGEELAAILDLSPSTVAHHLFILHRSGWIESQQVQYYQRYSLRTQAFSIPLSDLLEVPSEELHRHVDPLAYEQEVLEQAFHEGRLLEIPRAVVKRDIVLRDIASRLDGHRHYSLLQINRMLVEIHDDVAELRAALLEGGWISTTDRGLYKRA